MMESVLRQTNLAIEVCQIFNVMVKNDNVQHNLSVLGENPLVITDARCFMPWIASQYNMKLEKQYERNKNCEKGSGSRSNVDQDKC